MKGLDFLLGPAATALRVQHLLELLNGQLAEALRDSGCELRATSTGVALLLGCQGPTALAEIARQLGLSHQLATQRVRAMEKDGYVLGLDHPEDGRSRLIALTIDGEEQAARLQTFLTGLELAYQDLFAETGLDLMDIVRRVETALVGKSLAQRLPAGKKRGKAPR